MEGILIPSSSLGWLSKGLEVLEAKAELLLNPNLVVGKVDMALLGYLESCSGLGCV
jgi:hypothetical protein